jgi:predicted PurR-regulated permease PerM
VVRFAVIVGRAIQAQAVIAVVNTLLTAAGLWLLDIPSLTMLLLVGFVCSFIPVLGVFISTLPITLVALNNSGPWLAIAAIGLIIGVHLIEAFLLNPLIYGHRMKLNPVLVLIILFIGHHIFGIWGMVLGVPVTLYVLHDVFGLPPFPPSERSDAGPVVAPSDTPS